MSDTNKIQLWIKRYPVISFCALTFSITWGLKLLYALFRSKYGLPSFNFGLIASFGPSISALLLVLASQGKSGLNLMIRRLIDWHIGKGWILLAFLFEPLIFLSITCGYLLMHNELPVSDSFSYASIASYVLTFSIGLLRWGVAEEIGWRGWMLPKLQKIMSPISASIILSVAATLWHLNPNFASDILVVKEGTYIYGSFPEIIERLIITVPFTMVITFIFNRTKGSLLPMIIFHSASNTSYFWVKGVFGVVETDFFKITFLSVLLILGVLFSILLLRQKIKVTS